MTIIACIYHKKPRFTTAFTAYFKTFFPIKSKPDYLSTLKNTVILEDKQDWKSYLSQLPDNYNSYQTTDWQLSNDHLMTA